MDDALCRELCCPVCKGELSPANVGCVCSLCDVYYPILEGIPVLVPAPEVHASDIESAQAINPRWYVDEQPPEVSSPWRHHLRRRRRYTSAVIQREISQRGLKDDCRILDLGCGDGNNLVWLSEFTSSLYGSDYNLTRLARAKRLMPDAEIFLADIMDYPAPDGFFDVIFFNHVIEHIQDDVKALREVRRILKPGGVLVLGAPNEGCWWWQLAYKRDPESLRTTDHVHFYTAQSLKERMLEAGFNVFEVKSLGFGPPDWSLDGKMRKYKVVDDLFEMIGQIVMPSQASSLYLIADRKEEQL